jgi:hypothetical protein
MHGRGKKIVQDFVGKARRKDTTRKTKAKVENGIRMDLGEIGLRGVDWIRLAQDRDRWRAVVCAVMNLRVLAPRSSSTSFPEIHLQLTTNYSAGQ